MSQSFVLEIRIIDNTTAPRSSMNSDLQHILLHETIVVKQEVEFTNVILNLDVGNRYSINDSNGELLGYAAEEKKGFGGFLLRQLLNSRRPCTVHIFDKQMQEIAEGKKPFRFYFSEMSANVGGQTLGRTRRRFKILKRRYTIEVQNAMPFEIESSIFQIGKLKFTVSRNGQAVATISKHWEGVMKAMFTQADTFSIQFHDTNLTLEERATLLFTLFLIDYDVFEQR